MTDLTPALPLLNELVAPVLRALDDTATSALPPIMLIGAVARDVLHLAAGHTTQLRRTGDLDLALAVDGWEHFEELTSQLSPVKGASTAIRYGVGGHRVDLVPFGEPIEQPDGVVTPVRRGHAMSVFGFQDVHDAAHHVTLAGGFQVRVPTVPGYTLLKLKAWADRAADNEYKDGDDLAVAAYWYQNDHELLNARLWDTEEGVALLVRSEFDVPEAAVRLLVGDATSLLPVDRRQELVQVWAGVSDELLAAHLANPLLPGWPKAGSPYLAAWTRAIREHLAM